MENYSQFFSIFFGVLFGGLITLLVSYLYYKKASKDLTVATDKINKMVNFVVHILDQNDNQWKVKWNEKGNPIRLDLS